MKHGGSWITQAAYKPAPFPSTQELDFVLTKVRNTFFTGLVVLMSAGTVMSHHADAAPKQPEPTVSSNASATGGKYTPDAVVLNEKLHPTANLSYQVAGKRYYPQTNADNFSETGQASWYGPGFHGKKTSNGERFDMNVMSAAHRTLPIPSYARVTNLANGKSVIVRINDRGPFHGNRVIDLSKAAANKLGFLHKGTARVKVEALKASDLSNNSAQSLPQKAI